MHPRDYPVEPRPKVGPLGNPIPEGPWTNEPDHEWAEVFGFMVEIRRQQVMGHYCGYVWVPPTHPWAGQHYDDLDVDCHGGLTLGRPSQDDQYYIFGFDCAHLWDLTPYHEYNHDPENIYRDIHYVRRGVISLALQAAVAQRTHFKALTGG